jgi:hypothetical protein
MESRKLNFVSKGLSVGKINLSEKYLKESK